MNRRVIHQGWYDAALHSLLQYRFDSGIIDMETKMRQLPGVGAPESLRGCVTTYTAAIRPHRSPIIRQAVLLCKGGFCPLLAAVLFSGAGMHERRLLFHAVWGQTCTAFLLPPV